MTISGQTLVAGIVGHPVRHSLSPVLHNAWLQAAGIDGVYVPFCPSEDGFERFIDGLRGGALRGLNVTVPFKPQALALADHASGRAKIAAAANVLLFQPDGTVVAENTDGVGVLAAFEDQAPGFDPQEGPVVILGAGGGAQGAAAAFAERGAPEVRIVNRTLAKAEKLASAVGARGVAYPLTGLAEALVGASALVNASSATLGGGGGVAVPLELLPPHAVVMDMVYVPLETDLLKAAQARGLRTVDGLAMLIGQAVPSFEAFFGRRPPNLDVRTLALAALEARE